MNCSTVPKCFTAPTRRREERPPLCQHQQSDLEQVPKQIGDTDNFAAPKRKAAREYTLKTRPHRRHKSDCQEW
jgi:hypothetical protein